MDKHFTKINCSQQFLSETTQNWLVAFINEADLFERANSWHEFWRVYKEEPLLTLFATGIARVDTQNEVSILREYPVFSSGQFIGSSDLFLNYFQQRIEFFIEGKYERARWETGYFQWSEDNHGLFIREVEKQVSAYIDAERNSNFRSFSVILLFNVVDFKKEIDYNEYRQLAVDKSIKKDSFYAFIPAENPEESPYKTFGVLEVVGFIKEVGDQ